MGRNEKRLVDRAPLEIWAGLECTVNRVGDRFFNQFEQGKHHDRPEDLDRLAALGVSQIRYPVLWETVSPTAARECDWAFSDERLTRMRELGLEPIVGLCHHGSGPTYTDLLSPTYEQGLALHARQVAERFPWVRDYTPVNEPLTTARFSGLYGHWYPHATDERSFLTALFHQLRATVLAMRAIRKVRPDARLVQTEDLGKTHAVPSLEYQAEFENHRRWLSFDLLCGRVGEGHPLMCYLDWAGATRDELEWFRENPCPPDVIGVNHYLTSERFLDDDLDKYPSHTHGSNGRSVYADVEAVRVSRGADGPYQILREASTRYGLPIAVTEVHLGCTREEQMRWLNEVYAGASRLADEGADVRGVTVWSAFGAHDWDSLLTQAAGNYEPGAFDLRSPTPRATAITRLIRDLSSEGKSEEPLLKVPGWWHRRARLIYPHVRAESFDRPTPGVQPLLITGARGTLGRAFARLCDLRGIPYKALSRPDLDIANERQVARALSKHLPWAVINCAGYVRVDDAERDLERCFRENAVGPEVLARQCKSAGAKLVTFSSDLVFDGGKSGPYFESDEPSPLNAYGRSKQEGERRVLAVLGDALVVRTSAFLGSWDAHNFGVAVLRTLAAEQPFFAPDDQRISPTYVVDLVNATLDLLIDGECGVVHLANRGSLTWADLGVELACRAGLDRGLVKPITTSSLGLAAKRPRVSALESERMWVMPALESALDRFVAGLEVPWRAPQCLEDQRIFVA